MFWHIAFFILGALSATIGLEYFMLRHLDETGHCVLCGNTKENEQQSNQ